MDEVSIVKFVEDDLSFGKNLTDEQGWNRPLSTWRRMLRVSPDGFLKATLAGEDIGIAAVLSYGKVAWINSVIVSEDYRGRGVGRALMKKCIARAWETGAETIRLDSVPDVISFYAQLGFSEEYPSLRMNRIGNTSQGGADLMREEDLAEVIAFDRTFTRMSRGRVLESIFRDNPGKAFIMRDLHGVRGYLLSSQSDVSADLGPCVCRPRDDRCASILISSAMAIEPNMKCRACLSERNTAAVMVLNDLGFGKAISATRMSQGRRFVETESNYLMISPAEG